MCHGKQALWHQIHPELKRPVWRPLYRITSDAFTLHFKNLNSFPVFFYLQGVYLVTIPKWFEKNSETWSGPPGSALKSLKTDPVSPFGMLFKYTNQQLLQKPHFHLRLSVIKFHERDNVSYLLTHWRQ